MNTIFKKVLSVIVSFNLVFTPSILSASSNVISDKDALKKYQATVESARNGVTVVNIVAPNSKGLSHNKYTQYNVAKDGLILNNSNKRDVQTQLGGLIFGNKNLANKNTAKIILNEVTSKNKSTLEGYTEVAGDSASVVVANPNGILVKGGGFINTPKATLTTGVPQISNEQIQSYQVQKGIISIDGESFNTKNVDKLEIYSKAVKFNTKLYANDLDIVTGTNNISKDGIITKIDSSNTDEFSLDSTALGGIYANKINLIGTSNGVG